MLTVLLIELPLKILQKKSMHNNNNTKLRAKMITNHQVIYSPSSDDGSSI